MTRTDPSPSWGIRAVWFVGLWAGSAATVGAVAYLLMLWLRT